ncbi:MAG: hypothetical protein JOZ69_14595, partial [Myxococcales bacterium]|nr:hypothetical protein [Myxococcales bacterium]
MGRSFARLRVLGTLLFACLLTLMAGAPSARAAEQEEGALAAPRDVALVVQPASAPLPPVPSDFQRIDRGFLTLEFPSSLRERAEALAAEAEAFRARVS